MRRLSAAAIGLILTVIGATAQPALGPQGPPENGTGREDWRIPSPITGLAMHAVVIRPPGPGPFRLAVINHGSDQNAIRRVSYVPPQYAAAARWFLARG